MSPLRSGALIVGLILLMRLGAAISGYDPAADVHPELASQGPSAAFWLGTDHLGRDVAQRLMHGSAAFVEPGLGAAVVTAALGLLFGTLGGYLHGGGAPRVVAGSARYLMGVLASIPALILVLLVVTIYGGAVNDWPLPEPGLMWLIALGCGLVETPALAGALAARLDGLRRAEFVLAARAHGISPARILLYHLLWVNGRGLVARHALVAFAQMVVVETTLSYLGGFGVPEPSPSWGNMLAFELAVVDGNPLAWLAPAAAIWVGVAGLYGLSATLGADDA